ncbi:MAG: ankyrin repeat domain-containing protein [Holosporales bacterium]|jgi:ankyrin repeat protein|nr:ankyrin repeat domain-containing protein [Holosporales bacterium]
MKRFYKTMALASLLGISNFSYGTSCDANAALACATSKFPTAEEQNDFSTAIARGECEKVKKLISDPVKRSALISTKNPDGGTPLHYAALFGFIEIVKVLLTANANKDAKDNYGLTPLHYGHEKTEVVKVLLAAGASRNVEDNYGCTPRDRARSASEKRLLA